MLAFWQSSECTAPWESEPASLPLQTAEQVWKTLEFGVPGYNKGDWQTSECPLKASFLGMLLISGITLQSGMHCTKVFWLTIVSSVGNHQCSIMMQ